MRFKKSTISAMILIVALTTIIGLSGVNYLIPQQGQEENQDELSQSTGMEKIFLTTKDNVNIAANFYGTKNPIAWVVFIHMMPATKESWQNLAAALENIGYESIAIDLRGHGESTGGPEDDYKNFSDAEHQKSILDLTAAVDYLITNRGATPDKISFVGASIGANLSLQYISEHPESKTAVLLSAGLNYRGIKTEPLAKNLTAGQRIFFVSSKDDSSNVQENEKLYQLVPDGVIKEIKVYGSGGHGTDILENQPDLNNLIFNFIK